ncbi:glycosyltransferase [Glaciecola sp. XM2]|uniref:glycosyltransferase n=1 Tax=Glaciecola sp. XM2 TaxID=1914931 RepID=UPI001BDF68E6|nr:glycosyltransferase [Glaciecola sp. XM2]MBT1450664.1 glycosyltransferase [Glaciecola sp. XM2]
MQGVFWVSLFGIAYSYFVYPVLLFILSKLVRAQQAPLICESNKAYPSISLIITCHNEQHRIKEKIENTLELEYPDGKLELIIASDCSTDDTDDIVKSYAQQGVKLVRADVHNGKEYAQKLAIDAADGELLVFSDVATQIPTEALKKVADKFHDPRVGAVSSEDKFISDDGTIAGEGAYVKYEMWLRALETKTGGLVGLSGSFFAARKEVCQQHWDIKSPSDFNTALNCGRLGYIAISCDDVLGYYKDVKDPQKEYARKVRTVLRGITAVSRNPDVLNPVKFGVFSFKVWSHKIMRWAVPWFMLLALLSNLSIYSENGFYALTFYLQAIGYILVLLTWKLPSLQKNTLLKLGFFFVQVNLAIAHSTVNFLMGRRMVTWTPSKR